MGNRSLKYKLTNNHQTYGCWLTIAHPLIPEILAPAGFDWLVVDMEHTSIELNDLLALIISIENNKIDPLVRLGENNPNIIKRVMDVGASGIIMSNICSPEDVEIFVNAVKYPPLGTRGVGLYRAQKYGNKFEEYLHWLEYESIVIIQIESIKAVQQIDKIFSIPGIDAFIIGPYDLSGSLGKPGQLDDKEVLESIEIVLQAGKKYNIPAGFHSVSSDPEKAIIYKNNGFNFLGFSLDSILLGDSVVSAMDKIRNSK